MSSEILLPPDGDRAPSASSPTPSPDGDRPALVSVSPSRAKSARVRTVSPSASALLLAIGAGLVVAAVYALFGWRQWHSLYVPSWDLGIFSELAKAYSGFGAPIVPIKGEGFNLLGDHFHPLLVLTGGVWALWPSGVSLLILQAALFGLSAIPLTRLAIEKWGAASGLVLGLVYGFGWGLQSAIVSQFHEIAFAVPILAFSLAAYLRGRLLATALWAGALVFVKEDLGLTVAALGLVMTLRPRHRGDPSARRIGLLLAVWGVAWLVLATAVILPALNPHEQYDYTGRIGNPLEFFLPLTKWVTVAMLIGSAGIIGLRSPLMALMLPTLAWRFVGNVEFYWGWQWHYSAILMPITLAALIEGVDGWTESREGTPGPARWGAILVSGATTLALTTQIPMLALAQPSFHEMSPRWDAAHRAIASIPEGSSVVTDLTLMAYLVPSAEVYWLGNTNPAPEYVVIDYQGYWYSGTDRPSAEAWAEEQWGADYAPHFEEDGFAVVVRVP